MVMLRVPENVYDLEDQDIGCSWEELAAKQHRGDLGEVTKENLEEGDTYALLDRNCITEQYTNRVFVHVATDEYVLVFDENGMPIDDPSNFVVNGWQKLHGDHSFLEEWTDDGDGYYQLPAAPADDPADAPADADAHADARARWGAFFFL